MIAFLDKAERFVLAIVARLGPWLAPIGPAYAVARATMLILQWPAEIAWAVGVSVEAVGIAAAAATLRAYGWNRDKRKSDPPAPTWLGLACMAVYLVVGISLSVLVEVLPALIAYAPAALFVLASVGYAVLAMDGDQVRREAAVLTLKADEREDREHKRQEKRAALAQRAPTEIPMPVAEPAVPALEPAMPGAAPSVCQQCEREFKTPEALNAHRRWCKGAVLAEDQHSDNGREANHDG